MKTLRIPINAVSSRAYIEWQCGSGAGIPFETLSRVCGCYSELQDVYGCHHPVGNGQCDNLTCPIAEVEFPKGLSAHQREAFAVEYGFDARMVLTAAGKLGHGGEIKPEWVEEIRSADGLVDELRETTEKSKNAVTGIL